MSEIRLYNKLKEKNIFVSNVCEVGVYLPDASAVKEFIVNGINATLIEADPDYCKAINVHFGQYDNLTVYNIALYDYEGTVELCKKKSSTFLKELQVSPAIVNDNYSVDKGEFFTVNCARFSTIDKGNFDLVSIDIEGAEWFVIKHMISRPTVLAIETHGKYYTNPYLENILAWTKDNHYKVWYKDNSDTIFVREDLVNVTVFDKIMTELVNIKLILISMKKYLKIFNS